MAHMIPPTLAPNTESEAERRLYEAFERQLPDRCTVFHSARWMSRERYAGSREGEADFVVLDPARGALVIEVKGGMIRCERGEWFSNQNPIKNPFDQAGRNVHALVRKADEASTRGGWRRPQIDCAVAFPDVAVRGELGPDAPAEIVLDANALFDLAGAIERAYDYHQGAGAPEPLSAHDVAAFIDLLAPSRTLTLPMNLAFGRERERIVELTESQYRLLDNLRTLPRVAVRGAAGTGKTMLACEQARRLASQGYRVLLTCFNGALAGHLRQIVTDDAITVSNYHQICRDMATRAGLSLSADHAPANSEYHLQVELPELLWQAAETLRPQFDAVVVDEGQDFIETYWPSLQMLLRDPDHGILYVFYDNNQTLYGDGFGLPSGMIEVSLNENCRNTQTIHQSFMPFYRAPDGQEPVAPGPAGRPVVVETHHDDAELERQVRRHLHRLLGEGGLPREQVVVLGSHRNKGIVASLPRLGNYQLTSRRPLGPGEVYCDTIHYFKGLESAAIILALEPSSHMAMAPLCYVGFSRARNYLIVLAHEELPEEVLARLPPSAKP